MIPPRVEVLSALPKVFFLERVQCVLQNGRSLRIERTNDEKGFPRRWRLLFCGRELIDAQSPITFNGIDPFEQEEERLGTFSTAPNYVHYLDIDRRFGDFL
ncbi:MAG TPA: hypothetical protein VF522_13155 [Ramlibacter sp.]|uniref:hypothetical protein n=1 Tax=Ramlibacter sp. TaxID=1917967 RepID=UPI002ED199AB